MNERQFDELARLLTRVTSRRQVVVAFLAMTVSGLALGIRVGGASAQDTAPSEGATCWQDNDCAGANSDPCTGARCDAGTCAFFIVACIPGYVCCGNGECCPVGGTGSCLADTDCAPRSDDPCAGAHCEGGACVPFLATCAPDFACCGNGVCCPIGSGCAVDMDGPAFPSALGARIGCISGVCAPTAAPA